MTEIEIVREDSETKGRYVARIAGVTDEAELTFSKAGSELVIADHTAVPESMRGTGVGARLAARLVEDARSGGYAILALCPFVHAQAARHPEWSDVLRT
ncbi:GNAT family N-acetyltransferase [Cognatazoarcus halotolerans]|uniref:GNAT family N-acetyltransferase n=1 Tax=Cognatazoarcus halotolerans TaxID=2686016 RepID=UPI0013578182|nr:GNAT family N-acetyltransferase [Cognatazoarcus halotolerans]